MNILDNAIVAFTCGIVVFPDFFAGHSIIIWGVFILWIATKNDNVDGIIKVVYFLVLFYIVPSVINEYYAVLFLLILVVLFVMFSWPKPRNRERLKELDHPALKLLIPVYVVSVVDIALVFIYTGVIRW